MIKSGGTLQDVAELAGVSRTTAAAILRDAPGLRASSATRQRVLEASQRVGYRRNAIATSLKQGRTHVLGVLLPLQRQNSHSRAWRSYQEELLLAVLQAAARVDLRIIPIAMTGDRGSQALIPEVTDRRIDGLILAAIYDEAFRTLVEEAGVPCVEISGAGPYTVVPDNRQGAERAVEHLADLGHRHIVHWHGGGGYASDARLAGFQEKAAQAGIWTTVVYNAVGLKAALSEPAGESRVTALFAFNDYFACSALSVAREVGVRVPEDLSVVGFDDGILAEISVPQLTTVHNPLQEQAEAAVDMLATRLRGEEPEIPRVIVPTRLVVRSSTAPPPLSSL